MYETRIPSRADVVACTRTWIGTPYRHQGTRRGVGADCLGLVRGVWRELYGAEPETPRPYAPDWAEHGGSDRLVEAARRHCRAIETDRMQPGDILLFRWHPGLPAKHVGILTEDDRFVHAYERASVLESALVPCWRRRIAGIFAFPGVE